MKLSKGRRLFPPNKKKKTWHNHFEFQSKNLIFLSFFFPFRAHRRQSLLPASHTSWLYKLQPQDTSPNSFSNDWFRGTFSRIETQNIVRKHRWSLLTIYTGHFICNSHDALATHSKWEAKRMQWGAIKILQWGFGTTISVKMTTLVHRNCRLPLSVTWLR